MQIRGLNLVVKPHRLLAAVIFWAAVQTAMPAVLTHRYSFDTDASDLVANANGVLQGTAMIVSGALVLDGSNSCVQLPNDLFTNYDSISFEVWYADRTVSNPNSQLYNFRGALGGMSYSIFGEGNHFFGAVSNKVNLSMPAVGRINHLLWTQDSALQTARIYINGILAAQRLVFTNTPVMIGSTTNNLIGASDINGANANFKGNILEFRTYQGALTALDAAVSDAFGPDQPELNPGTLQAVRIVIPANPGPGAVFRPGVFADFSGITNVNISTQPDLVLSSDHTNFIAITSDQRVRTVAAGTANITATWQGFSNSVAVTVSVPQEIVLVHRYNFNEQTNDWIVHDSVGGAHGRLFNTGVHSPTNGVFTGQGEMKLAGSTGGLTSGYAALPPGIISSLSEVSIEAWVTWTIPTNLTLNFNDGAWQRIFDFGSSSSPIGGSGITYLNLSPASDKVSYTTKSLLFCSVTTNQNANENPRLIWTNTFPTNVLSQVVVDYSFVRKVMKVYLNGVQILSGTASRPLSGIIDTNNWLGRSQFSSDSYFYGRYDELRIYSGLLSDADVAAHYAAGPDAVGVDFILDASTVNNFLNISWRKSATNLILQSSPALGSEAVWNPVPMTPTFQNGRYSVLMPLMGNTTFYRLLIPEIIF